MKSVAILSVFCILFVWAVELSSADPRFCDLLENEDGLKSMVGCVNEHIPAFVIKLFEECYEVGFNEPGSLSNHFEKNCQLEQYGEEFTATIKCLEEKSDEVMAANGYTEQELENATSEVQDCLNALVSANDSSEELEEAVHEFVEEIDKAVEALE